MKAPFDDILVHRINEQIIFVFRACFGAAVEGGRMLHPSLQTMAMGCLAGAVPPTEEAWPQPLAVSGELFFFSAARVF